jgi:hypothetical protein
MKGITIAMFAVLLVSTAILGSGHAAFAYNSKSTRVFSTSGNSQETQKDCGSSCAVSWKTTHRSSGNVGSLTRTPTPTATVTSLTLEFLKRDGALTGTLKTDTGSPVVGATITFTGTQDGNVMPVITRTGQPVKAVTNDNGVYIVNVIGGIPFDSVTAHYAGTSEYAVSDSPPAGP